MHATPTPPAGQGNPLAGLVAVAVIGYLVAWMMGGPSPRHLYRLARDRGVRTDMTNPRSDDVLTPGEGPAEVACHDAMSPAPGAERGADERPVERHDEDLVVVSREAVRGWTYGYGPAPETRHLAGKDTPPGGEPTPAPALALVHSASGEPEEPPTRRGATPAERRRWLRWQEKHHPEHSPTWLEREGSKKFGCTEKTIHRDRLHIARKAHP